MEGILFRNEPFFQKETQRDYWGCRLGTTLMGKDENAFRGDG